MDKEYLPMETSPYEFMDKLDDEIIIREMQTGLASVAEKLFYSLDVGGQHIEGLSKSGIDECVRFMAGQGEYIRSESIDYRVDPTDAEYVLFSSTCSRYRITKDGAEIRLDSNIGTKRQWTKSKKKNGDIINDQFWFEKGSQKAQRNAKAGLVPQTVKQSLLDNMRAAKKAPHQAPTRQADMPPKNAVFVPEKITGKLVSATTKKEDSATGKIATSFDLEREDGTRFKIVTYEQITLGEGDTVAATGGRRARGKTSWFEATEIEILDAGVPAAVTAGIEQTAATKTA